MKNAQIGIITFHDAYSYGAVLQCYGLQQFLLKNKYDVRIIDYSMNGYLELRKQHKLLTLIKKGVRFLTNPKKFICIILNEKEKAKKQQEVKEIINVRNQKFQTFRTDHYRLSDIRYDKYSELHENPPDYAAYICGSDQIWNPYFCDRDSNYYLDFAPIEKRIAYAPSFGVTELPKNSYKTIKNMLENISFLSIRERSGQDIIQKLLEKKVPIVVDPTFLLNADEWLKIANESKLDINRKYVLTYFIGDDEYIRNYIDEVNKEFPNYEIKNLVFDYSNLGPCDFLKLIANAAFVFTNSFHGIAFCINFNIPFAIGKSLKDYSASSGFSRMAFLLEYLGLQQRIVTESNPCTKEWINLDFKLINEKLNNWRDHSKTYLLDAIDSVLSGGSAYQNVNK